MSRSVLGVFCPKRNDVYPYRQNRACPVYTQRNPETSVNFSTEHFLL